MREREKKMRFSHTATLRQSHRHRTLLHTYTATKHMKARIYLLHYMHIQQQQATSNNKGNTQYDIIQSNSFIHRHTPEG